MTVMDTTSVYEALKANQGLKVSELDDILPIDYPAIIRRLRKLRDQKQAICLGRGTKAGWFTMKYYRSNKVKLEAEYGKNCKMKPARIRIKEQTYFQDWCNRIHRFDSLMRPRV